MGMNAVFFAWHRSLPGREKLSAAHFGEFVEYLDGLKQKSSIANYEVVFLNPHGGELGGFFLIHGEGAQISGLVDSEAWQHHMMRANIHLEGSGAVRGHTGAAVMEQFQQWSSLIPD